MQQSKEFRRILVLRLLALATVSIPIIGVSLGGCYPCQPKAPREDTLCLEWPPSEAGDSGGGAAGAGGTGGSGGAVTCPPKEEAGELLAAQFNETRIQEVRSEGTFKDGACCYVAFYESLCPAGGRPFLVNDTAVVAPIVHGVRDGQAMAEEGSAPDGAGLSAEERAELALAWARDGQLEHASIASFGRFALSLLAVGAPAELVAEAHRAALDEVQHAGLCFGLASAYAGEPLGPGAFPFEGHVEVTGRLDELAARTAEEGCIGETVAACVAAEQLALATDPAVRRALEVIVADEARHAELAFRTVAWALRVGGPSVHTAVARVFAAMSLPTNGQEEPDARHFNAHGRLGRSAERAAMRRALLEVVQPAARRLLDTVAEAAPHVAALPS